MQTSNQQLLQAARKAVCFIDPGTRAYQDLKIALLRIDAEPVKGKTIKVAKNRGKGR